MHATSLRSRRPTACTLLFLLQLLLGIGALFGGGSLIIDPSGALIQLPLSLLEHTPFDSFLVPGIILFMVLGILPIIIAFGLMTQKQWNALNRFKLFRDRYWSWNFSLYTGFVLIGWITVQMYLVHGVALLHVIYIFWGMLIQAVTLLPEVQSWYEGKNRLLIS